MSSKARGPKSNPRLRAHRRAGNTAGAVRFLFFANTRDAAGCKEADLAIAEPCDADTLWARLIDEFPRLAPLRETVRLARNGSYVLPGERFSPEDEVALIPPVSGG